MANEINDIARALDNGEVIWENDMLVPATHVQPRRVSKAIRNLQVTQQALVERMEAAGFVGPETDEAHDALLEVEERLTALFRRG